MLKLADRHEFFYVPGEYKGQKKYFGKMFSNGPKWREMAKNAFLTKNSRWPPGGHFESDHLGFCT